MTHIIETPLSFLVFGNEACCVFAFFSFMGMLLIINGTGNYGFLGLLTIIQSVTLLEDSFWYSVLPHMPVPQSPLTPDILVKLTAWLTVGPYLLISLVHPVIYPCSSARAHVTKL